MLNQPGSTAVGQRRPSWSDHLGPPTGIEAAESTQAAAIGVGREPSQGCSALGGQVLIRRCLLCLRPCCATATAAADVSPPAPSPFGALCAGGRASTSSSNGRLAAVGRFTQLFGHRTSTVSARCRVAPSHFVARRQDTVGGPGRTARPLHSGDPTHMNPDNPTVAHAIAASTARLPPALSPAWRDARAA